MKANIKWIDGVTFLAESGTGHSLILDGPETLGGRGTGMRPMELLLLGMGGCTSFDMIQMLKKARQDITDCNVAVSAERSDDVPHVFTDIHVHYTITGRSVKAKQVERAISLSTEKYCSASIMLGASANITHDYTIVELEA